ncbi:hypothetical protein [Streptomyces sp. PAM3C]|uniref:hypothetical protein n=1 Tax=Streptomyces sp. PAM3C TaxID=2847300 RepID=UPI001C1E0565|nr:hypothetical protein [Streptomyces sp. PAM3C]MBU5944903.1 hypothetical protein [Streptomyces sp. PAM3C]
MSELEKAARDAVEAADNTEMVRQIAAVLAAQQILAQQQPQAPACQHRHGRSSAEWLGIGAAVCVGGVGLAFASIAIAIGALSVAVLALVVRSMWADVQRKGRR